MKFSFYIMELEKEVKINMDKNKYVIHYIVEQGIPVSADLIYTTEKINKIDMSGYFKISGNKEFREVERTFKKLFKSYKSVRVNNIYGRFNPVEQHMDVLLPIEIGISEEREVLAMLGFMVSDRYVASEDGMINLELLTDDFF